MKGYYEIDSSMKQYKTSSRILSSTPNKRYNVNNLTSKTLAEGFAFEKNIGD